MQNPTLFLGILCWLPLGYVFMLWAYGAEEEAYKLAKYALIFLLGVNAGLAVLG